jgi:hypothetical protein
MIHTHQQAGRKCANSDRMVYITDMISGNKYVGILYENIIGWPEALQKYQDETIAAQRHLLNTPDEEDRYREQLADHFKATPDLHWQYGFAHAVNFMEEESTEFTTDFDADSVMLYHSGSFSTYDKMLACHSGKKAQCTILLFKDPDDHGKGSRIIRARQGISEGDVAWVEMYYRKGHEK